MTSAEQLCASERSLCELTCILVARSRRKGYGPYWGRQILRRPGWTVGSAVSVSGQKVIELGLGLFHVKHCWHEYWHIQEARSDSCLDCANSGPVRFLTAAFCSEARR